MDSPYLIDGLDLYDEILPEALEKIHIFPEIDHVNDDQGCIMPRNPQTDLETKFKPESSIDNGVWDQNICTEIATERVSRISPEKSRSPTIPRPLFDLLGEFIVDCRVLGLDDLNFTLTPKTDTYSYRNSATPYTYSKSNLIMLVEEDQSMYNLMLIDDNHVERNVISVDGMESTQLHLLSEILANSHSPNSSQLFETPIRKKRPNTGMRYESPNTGLSSPEFWPCAVASAEEIENNLKVRQKLHPNDLADVVRCLDFSPSSSTDPDSPYVCSMIKRIKDRNADKVPFFVLLPDSE
ncbi:hypothetical protein ZOSMA_47G00610 [Zostera marina]|uniref:Uncharacterized protein n=1 Tax=Zostera marina TaxID=29655 RepID=A0A0K9NZW7_ZOSMR|nr:hypothetical protein ZOSMA_47G00610 [Zostera marina]